ncbi:MAG: aryl-sulfate sulfotransferase [Bacteroidota bacterium]
MKPYTAIKTICLGIILLFIISSCQKNQDPGKKPQVRDLIGLDVKRGLTLTSSKATPGYVLFNPLSSAITYLVNLDGQVVHTWESEYGPSGWLYLRENGNLARGGRDPETPVFVGGGHGGWIEEFNWEGEIVWKYKLSSTENLAHHDVAILPNGNFLAIAWEAKSPDEAIAYGRDPKMIPKAGLWPDWVVELKPIGSDSALRVWEWHLWDHTIQEFDQSKKNFGKVADHPELIDINLGHLPGPITQEELDELKAQNNASTNSTLDNRGSDLNHTNAIHYNERLDQIVLSSPHYDEIFIIDHSTTTEEAASHEGGRWGKGGDILYRWGNPANYQRGDSTDLKLAGQHDVKWVDPGLPGAGHLMVFNNRVPYGNPPYSEILELETELSEEGYALNSRGIYGPDSPVWSYVAKDTLSFFAPFISGAHRMKNGNTFITEGTKGRFFEVNPAGDLLWEYLTPYAGDVRMPDGTTTQPVGPFKYATFRATHIMMDHPAISGKLLKPLIPQPKADTLSD